MGREGRGGVMNRGKSEHVLLIERELGSPNRAEGNLRINNLSSTAGKQCLMVKSESEEKISLASLAWQ